MKIFERLNFTSSRPSKKQNGCWAIKACRPAIGALIFCVLSFGTAVAQSGDIFELTEVVISSGGGPAANGDFEIDAVSGQPVDGLPIFGNGFAVMAGFWNITPPVPPVLPSAPGNLEARALSTTQIALTWADNSDNENNFELERCDGKGKCRTFMLIASPGENNVGFTDAGLAPATQYAYRVRAANEAGNSAYSNTAKARTLRR